MVWSLKTGRLLGTFAGVHTGSVLCLKFERDWDLESFDPSLMHRKTRQDETSLSTDPDLESDLDSSGLERLGRKTGFMFTGSSDCTICVWRLESGELLDEDPARDGMEEDRDRWVLAEPVAVLKGHTGGVLDLRIDQQWIVSW